MAGPPPPPRLVTTAKISAALPKLDALATRILQRTGVPGMAIAVVHDDRVVFLRGYGQREVGMAGAVDPDTIFQLASLSKPIASTVVAALVGDGRVRWDDPVIGDLPGFRLGPTTIAEEVTLRDLLSHRSGLPDHAGDLLEDIGFDRDTIFQRLGVLPLGNRFRAVFNYTNFGFTAGAIATANASGQGWEELSKERLYRPLGMGRTSSSHADFVAASNRAALHVREAATGADSRRWVARHQRNADAQSPAGGVSSTARDLSQWLRLQLAGGRLGAAAGGHQIVSPVALSDTHRPLITSAPSPNPAVYRTGFYGLGWNVSSTDQGAVQLSHSGGFELGASTAVYLLPGESLGLVVLTNGQPIGVPETVALSFLDLARFGKVELDYLKPLGALFAGIARQDYPRVPQQPTDPAPARPLATYSGRYSNGFVGEIAVKPQGSGLVLELGPQRRAYPLTHISGDTFRYQPSGENASGPSAVAFSVGGDGPASRVQIDNFNVDGQGVFQRQSPAASP
ncbi:serine hydrolase [Synechococcus sp. BA-124 BA4]|uniref:serine hydrolase n=1 Tax=unclassified Synechococcus TaxID=2626047 RepID=UPI002AD5964B|nr:MULTISPECIES: serine hydrolase [unclassified Synechococcus]MEA5398736.1 serine hydrolase [Synechococcus sp. BA-124 BA4]CAK6696099.1 D-aminopeptidase [Synechococcus sp. CBW1107]